LTRRDAPISVGGETNSRGTGMRLMIGLLLLLAMPALAQNQPSQEPLRIGVLTDESGNFAGVSGAGSVIATRMAVEDFGGSVLGRPIVVLDADHKNKPDLALSIAREWYDGGVYAITELTNSAVALAVQDLAKQRNRIALFAGPGTVDITGPRCGPTTFLWTWDTYADAVVPVRALMERGGKKWFFLTADFAFGAAMQRDATAAVTAAGGTVVGAVKHPLGETDFASYLLQAQASGADVLALANGGGDLINAIKQAAEFGITRKQMVAALALNITDVHALGLERAQGLLTTEGFYWDRDEQSRAFSRRFLALHGAMPTQSQAGQYSSVLHMLKAIAAAGATDPLTVAAMMRKMPVEDAFAHGGKLRGDGRMVHDMYLVQIKSPAESRYPWDYYTILATVPGEQAFRPRDVGGCPLLD
jgi:branched-chain amino acid transport system substrate-binding protein